MLIRNITIPCTAANAPAPPPSVAIPMPTGEIKTLTSLRGIAAVMVVMQHFSTVAALHGGSPIPSLVPHGYIAVDLFFVLSGFIMAYTYLADFKARGIHAFPDFLLKRVARIVPLNTAAVILVLLGGVILTTPLIFLSLRSCADSDGFPTRSGDFVDEGASWGWKRRTCAIADG